MAKPSSAEAQLYDVDGIEFWLSRKRVKNINIRIKPPTGRVEVSAPSSVSLDRIKKLIAAKRGWIEYVQHEIATGPIAEAYNATPEEQQEWRDVVEKVTPFLIAKWEPIIGVHAGTLVYRNMRSRWGSCQPSTGRICINTRLALYPPECIEYVVVHELCHLRERGHGAAFHALMDRYMPNWKAIRAELG